MNGIHICFGPPLVTERPLDPLEGYRLLVPYPFDWRGRLGKAVCDCTQVVEQYRPWIGLDWSHAPECAIEKHVQRYPGIQNFVEYTGVIAYTD